VLILKVVKVLCFDTLLQVLILNVVSQKMNALAAVTLCLALIVAPFLRAQSGPDADADSSFRIEIHTDIDGKPSFTLTNLSNDTLTACVIRFSLSSKPTWHSQLDWDSIVQDSPLKRAEDQPLEAGASVTMYLPHAIGESLPDKVEVVAAIWADGQTFGDTKWVKVLLHYRASLARDYEDSISMLQRGLDENWTRDQYLDAVNNRAANSEPSEVYGGPTLAIRNTLRGNRTLDGKPQLLRRTIQNLQASFEQKLDLLRKAKPAFDGWSTTQNIQLRSVL
jgi:hypothetical protein